MSTNEQAPAPVAGDEDTRPASDQPVEAIGAGREVARMREIAISWRHPSLRQIEGPNDLKIYGGTIADDIDRWADMIAVLSPASPARTPMGEPVAWIERQNDGTRYGEPKRWPPSDRARSYAQEMGRTIEPLYAAASPARPELTVWYGKMPESNGRENWTAELRRVHPIDKWDRGFCFARSEYPGRVLYEADRVRWIIGERAERPDILAYDADAHSGYVEPASPARTPMGGETEEEDLELPDTPLARAIYKHFCDVHMLNPDEAADATGELLAAIAAPDEAMCSEHRPAADEDQVREWALIGLYLVEGRTTTDSESSMSIEWALGDRAALLADAEGWALEDAREDYNRIFCDRTNALSASPARTSMGEPQVLKGVGKINGDGWKDTTSIGEVVYVWNAEKPSPYAPGQYPRIDNEGWSASTAQYDFSPASIDEVRALAAPTPMGGEVEALREAVRLALEDADALERIAEEADDNQWPDWSATMRQAALRIKTLAASSPSPAQGGVVLPEEMTPEMEAVWRAAFIHQGHNRRGRGAAGNARRLKHPESCEQIAWRALRKHLLAAPPSVQPVEGK